MNTITLASIIAGLLLLLVGRKVFWIFLSLAGIALALDFLPRYFPQFDQQTLLIVSLAAGVLGGVLAFALAKTVDVVGGGVAGGYLGVIVWHALAPGPGFPWVPAIVGGVLGILAAKFVFTSVLILASSAMGAALLVHVAGLEGTAGLAALVVLTAAGIIVQGRLWPRPSPERSSGEEKK
jgi:hypothetical protein